MSAEVETMFYAGDVPWHGQGVAVAEAQSSADALRLAGLDWDVVSTPVMVNNTEIDGYKANVRSTDGAILGMVSDRYKPIQNREGFAFVDDLLGMGVKFETAGSLFGGKRVWMLAHLEPTKILDDEIVPYLVFTNGHDGKHPVSVCMANTRVVCQNTLNAALAEAKRTWSFRHIGDLESRKREASETLMLANQYTVGLKAFGEEMAQKRIDAVALNRFIDRMFPLDDDMSNRVKTNVERYRNEFLDIYTTKTDLANIRGTAWGIVNAMSDFASHVQPLRKTDTYKEKLFASFLDGNEMLDKAVELMIAV